VFSLIYSFLIHGARSVTVYQIVELVFIILCKKKSTKKQMCLFVFIALACISFINSSIGNDFIDSFLVGGDAGSTTGRIEALAYDSSTFLDWNWFFVLC